MEDKKVLEILNIEIIKDHITPGLANRPCTNPKSSLYNKRGIRSDIIYHNPAWKSGDAWNFHKYGKGKTTPGDLKSWNYSVSADLIIEMVPPDEATFQAGDNLGPGNTDTCSMEVADRAMYRSPVDLNLFWRDQETATKLCAYLIFTGKLKNPFPLVMKQHNYFKCTDGTYKNCPYWVRREPGGWQKVLDMTSSYLKLLETYIEPEEVIEIKEGTSSRFILFTGSYSNLDNARREKVRLKSEFIDSTIIRMLVGDRYLYRVVVKEGNERGVIYLAQDYLGSKGISSTMIDLYPPVEVQPEATPEPTIPEPEETEDPNDLKTLLTTLIALIKQLLSILKIGGE